MTLGRRCAAFVAFGGAILSPWPFESAGASAPVYGYEVINVYPHDPQAFTQGLITADGLLYEGTGLYGESSLRKVVTETGAVLEQYDLAPAYFGEGIAALRDTIYQLTWTNHVGFSYVEGDGFELVETFPYPWEGWGLTHNGTLLIASDGSSTVRFLEPSTRELISQIEVQDAGAAVDRLNELEYVRGRIYANVWGWDRIAVIHPATGEVESWIDLGGLRDSLSIGGSAGVLNGIAFEPGGARLFVTGKRWARLFEIDSEPLHTVSTAQEGVSPPGRLVLQAFPLPTRRWVHFILANPAGTECTAQVFDHGGKRVASAFRGGDGRTAVLDTADLVPGVYFVKLVSQGSVDTKKILVVR